MTKTMPSIREFKMWPGRDKPRVLINPAAIASVKEEGHSPAACTIEMVSGTSYLVQADIGAIFEWLSDCPNTGAISYVLPADVVSGVGQNNSLAGAEALDKHFTSQQKPEKGRAR